MLWRKQIWREQIFEAVEYASKNRALIVLSAGNLSVDNDDHLFTSDVKDKDNKTKIWKNHVICATAYNYMFDRLDENTVRGDVVDIAVPTMPYISKAMMDGTVNGAQGGWTSGAAALVSGTAGLLLSYNKGLSVTQIKRRY